MTFSYFACTAKINLLDPFAEEEASSSPSTWTLFSRLEGGQIAADVERDTDNAETNDENALSPLWILRVPRAMC